jgi:hypothetical protein
MSETKLCGSASDDSSVGSEAWVTATAAQGTADGSSAQVALAVGQTSHYLKCVNFGFTIPGAETITQVRVTIKKMGPGRRDSSVRLVWGAGIAGDDNADTVTDWPGSLTEVLIAPGDNWGLALTPADVNDAAFGVVISAVYNAFNMDSNVYVDSVQIEVVTSAAVDDAEVISMRSHLAISQP